VRIDADVIVPEKIDISTAGMSRLINGTNVLAMPAIAANLVISELHYHPLDPTEAGKIAVGTHADGRKQRPTRLEPGHPGRERQPSVLSRKGDTALKFPANRRISFRRRRIPFPQARKGKLFRPSATVCNLAGLRSSAPHEPAFYPPHLS
jgi:hypothetical protein